MNAIQTNQNKKNSCDNTNQNKKKNSDIKTDDQIFEEHIIMAVQGLVKFSYGNFTGAINDKLEDYDGNFEDLCKEKRWTKKCLTVCKVMDRKIQEKINFMKSNPEIKINAVSHYRRNYSDGDMNNMWNKNVIFATQDYEEFYRVYNSFSV